MVSAGSNMTALFVGVMAVLSRADEIFKLKLHHWMRESHSPRYLQAWTYLVLLFCEVMAVYWLADTIFLDS